MNIEWTGIDFDVHDRLRDRIRRGLEKMGRQLREPVDARVVLAAEGHDGGIPRQRAEIFLRHRIGPFTASHECHDMEESVSRVLSKLQTQVRRARRKVVDNRRRGGDRHAGPPTDAVVLGRGEPSSTGG